MLEDAETEDEAKDREMDFVVEIARNAALSRDSRSPIEAALRAAWREDGVLLCASCRTLTEVQISLLYSEMFHEVIRMG